MPLSTESSLIRSQARRSGDLEDGKAYVCGIEDGFKSGQVFTRFMVVSVCVINTDEDVYMSQVRVTGSSKVIKELNNMEDFSARSAECLCAVRVCYNNNNNNKILFILGQSKSEALI